ncbi:class I SAM-dependent methyltransferase [Nonomuraea sp. NPDC049158]|uniref:SAM-dependent methyltransferase n=1 Tax=Nonomuraea sp. NPDC049158 TaxID=3155649 RepID=UPI0033C5111E
MTVTKLDAAAHRRWLGKTMALSCGLWEGTNDLDTAQLAKFGLLSDWAEVTAQPRVLDVGSGYGGLLSYLSRERGVAAACGVDASDHACREAEGLRLPGVTIHQGDYRAFTPDRPYDAVVSIGLLENVDGTPDPYAEFFAHAHAWTRPGARLALESTIRGHSESWPAEAARYVEAMRRLRLTGTVLTLDRLLAACGRWWEPIHVRTHRDDYARTFATWATQLRGCCDRLGSVERDETTLADWLDFTTTGMALFQQGALSVAHLGLRRIDQPTRPPTAPGSAGVKTPGPRPGPRAPRSDIARIR